MRQVIASAEGPGGERARVCILGRSRTEECSRAGGLRCCRSRVRSLLATVLLWLHNEQLDRQLADLRNTVEQQKQELAETRHQADLIAARETLVIPMWSQKGAPADHGEGHARVLYNAKEGMMTYDGWLPPAPADKSYQLWLVPMNGAPISAGVFNPKNGEMSHMMMKLPQGVTAKEFAVTLEPAGGMPQPTGPDGAGRANH